jgi:hypothetical protein
MKITLKQNSVPKLDFSHNFEDTKKQLRAIAGHDNQKFHFQTFLDLKVLKEEMQTWSDKDKQMLQRLRERCTKVLHGTLKQHLPTLIALNQLGAGIYITVNKCRGRRRTAKNVVELRSLFIDKDNGQDLRDFSIEPSMVVQSKKGPHAYWLLKPKESIDRFTLAQMRLISFFDSDSTIHDPSRVMRLVGFYHLKSWEEPFLIRLNHAEDRRYTIDEVLSALPATKDKNKNQSLKGQIEQFKLSKDTSWHKKYDLDLRTLDAVSLFKDHTMYDHALSVDKHVVRCPQYGLHTTGQDGDTSTVLFQNGETIPGFKCLHAHCGHFTMRDVLEFFGKNVIEKYALTRKQAVRRANREGKLPEILISGLQQRDVVQTAWEAIHVKNEELPKIFRRGNIIVEPVLNDSGGGILSEVSKDKIFGLLIRYADIVKFTNGSGIIPANLPEYVAKDMITIPDEHLPTLDTITGSPFFDKNGNLISDAGYNLNSESWLQYPKGFSELQWIDEVDKYEAQKKTKWIMNELFSDFPFTSSVDLTHTFATLLLPFIRRMIDGPTPLALFSAPVAGSGKTLLAKIISIILMGNDIPVQVLSGSEEERRKMLLAELILGRPIALLDNLDDEISQGNSRTSDRLHSPSLAAVLTSTDYTDRLLSTSRKITVKNSTVWILTGNNPQLSVELSRRCVLIRLEPSEEKPWERKQFKHDDILRWTRENRAILLEAILGGIQSWISAGKPTVAGKSLGSYEDWSNTMRSLLNYLGFDDFLENQNEVDHVTDPIRSIWNELVQRWFEKFGSKSVSAEQILSLDNDSLLDPLLGRYDEGTKKHELGRLLGKQHGRIYSSFKIARIANDKKGHRYALVPILKKGRFGEDKGDNGIGRKEQYGR